MLLLQGNAAHAADEKKVTKRCQLSLYNTILEYGFEYIGTLI